ncbi:DUF5305 family protein [Psychrobacillus sp. FSL H8-0484]|uniref:DUF5305 family protein n=1 Tax=Psychrobacillus sp. FSL H8-0484 TaxID=2921390 RepID=UPI0030F4D26A
MRETLDNVFKKYQKKFTIILLPVLVVAGVISVYTLMQPTTITNQVDNNVSHFQTSYDYKATITPNILYPTGGTIEVGDTMYKKITNAIPFTINSTINSENEVIAKGTHEFQLLIKAGDLWEKSFPLAEKQSFAKKGTAISIIDKSFKIDIEKVKTFILKVEEETGIRTEEYTIEIVPNIQGTIISGGIEKDIKMEDKLIFQYFYEEIKLATEKKFISTIPFTTTEISKNMFTFFGSELPLTPVRIISSVFSLLFILVIIYMNKNFWANRKKNVQSLAEKINKKYGKRMISVSQKVETSQKSIILLNSFKAIIQIADAKELPIFYYNMHLDESKLYFIIDGNYMYQYEINEIELARSRSRSRVKNNKNEAESDPAYALD